MKRSCEAMSHFLIVTGLVLLALSLVLTPEGRALADDGGGASPLAKPCVDNKTCDKGLACFVSQPSCKPSAKNWCNRETDLTNCGGCRCVPIDNDCQCKP
jgi:hypothetical protein